MANVEQLTALCRRGRSGPMDSCTAHFVEKCVNDERCLEYPLSSEWTVCALTQLIAATAHEDAGGLRHALQRLGEQPQPDLDVCYKHFTYVLPSTAAAVDTIGTVICRLSTAFLECSGTGWAAWDAGFVLGEIVLERPELFRTKSVVELGAGVGIAAVCLMRHASPASMVLTDGDEDALGNLRHNLCANKVLEVTSLTTDDDLAPPQQRPVSGAAVAAAAVEVRRVQWEEDQEWLAAVDVDVVIAESCLLALAAVMMPCQLFCEPAVTGAVLCV